MGDKVSPGLAPVLMRSDKVPAWGLERSTVELQNVSTVRYNQPAPKDRNRMATIGAETWAPTTIDREANPIPSRLLKKACVGDARREQGAKSGLFPNSYEESHEDQRSQNSDHDPGQRRKTPGPSGL